MGMRIWLSSNTPNLIIIINSFHYVNSSDDLRECNNDCYWFGCGCDVFEETIMVL